LLSGWLWRVFEISIYFSYSGLEGCFRIDWRLLGFNNGIGIDFLWLDRVAGNRIGFDFFSCFNREVVNWCWLFLL